MSGFGAAKTAEGIKNFVKSEKFTNALKNMSEVKTKLCSVIKALSKNNKSIRQNIFHHPVFLQMKNIHGKSGLVIFFHVPKVSTNDLSSLITEEYH